MNAPGQPVFALWQADRQLARRTTIELGGAAGTGSAASWGPAVLDVEQPVLDELVQVEGGQPAGHPDRVGGLLAADRMALAAHVFVQRPARRVGEGGDGGPAVLHPTEIITSLSC